ncbi:MAG: hypothetical protein VR72_19655 [Clostridiaceae bacterium BRH_c20a]|nr:MAG: hypothetical protein VR72_19655 [Clostridiaceae bacterium BRH_c20a]
MIISSLILKCLVGFEEQIRGPLANIKGLSIETVLEGQLILVLESPSVESVLQIMDEQILKLQGVIGVYPVYIHYETA